jgi:hypothetical protein
MSTLQALCDVVERSRCFLFVAKVTSLETFDMNFVDSNYFDKKGQIADENNLP